MKSPTNLSKILNLVFITSAVAGYAARPVSAAEPKNKVGSSIFDAAPSDRMSKRFGTSLGIGEPAPGLFGLNVGYNIYDFLRATAGYSQMSTGFLGLDASTTTIGAGVKGFMPGWNLTPTVGLHYAHVSYSGNGLIKVGGLSESGSSVYTSVGADYTAKNGFNGGLGYNIPLKSGVDGGLFANIGWYFDWLN